jgi:queuine tRNA-ribosyltransferase
MHSVTEPLVEAMSLYIQQSGFKKLLAESIEWALVIWDVGLGAGTNAMAAIMEYEKTFLSGSEIRPMKIISFEKDLDSMSLAVNNQPLFPHLHHAAPRGFLSTGTWKSAKFPVEWVLFKGNFLDLMESADIPGCIFYDPFSIHTDTNMWSYDTFRRINRHCSGHDSALFTYSGSTMVRSALLAAGFYVGAGAGTGPKSETTAAFTSPAAVTAGIELLGRDWLQRFHRSSSKFSTHASAEEQVKIMEMVINHPQFKGI